MGVRISPLTLMQFKICSTCKVKVDIEFFGRNKSKSDGFQSQCKSCKSTTQRNWYQSHDVTHKVNVRINAKKQKAVLRDYVRRWLLENPCVVCGEPRLPTLDFDHVRGKKQDSVSSLVRSVCSLTTLQKEIAKCEVVCSNCHRIRTYERAGWTKYAP